MQHQNYAHNFYFILFSFLCTVLSVKQATSGTEPMTGSNKPNVLIITVDDMSCDSVGVYGCKLAATTPHMDALAATALRFEYAHVQVGNCMPSRNVMWSGRYPHNNGVEGFYQVRDNQYPVLCDLAQAAGYHTSIRHKISHSTPHAPYGWDLELVTLPDGSKPHVKDAASYGHSTRQAIQAAGAANKPFCSVINISDPHKPFYSQVKGGTGPDPFIPTRIFKGAEVPVPGFLCDDPTIRDELALYYSSVRRADDAVGFIFEALKESGQEDNTFVLFLSDHGMPLPFAKTQLYHHSTRTPLMVRWPGVTQPNSRDEQHMVSAVDFIPTLAEVMGFEPPSGLDGRSFAPLLRGETQGHRTMVFKEYNENSGSKRNPMRAIETKEYLYLFNPWSDGKLVMATATNGTQTWKRMKELASADSKVAARVDLMEHRVLEELYQVASDPDCLVNLIDDPAHASAKKQLRAQLLATMQTTSDPIAEVFVNRADADFRAEYMQRIQKEATERRNQRKKQQKPQSAINQRQNLKLINWLNFQRTATEIRFKIEFKLPAELGPQSLVVTLKTKQNKRIERKTYSILGSGTQAVSFLIPEQEAEASIRLAAFVGTSFDQSLQYLQKQISARKSHPKPAN